MITIEENKTTGKWVVTVNSIILGDKYANEYQASKKLCSYLKSQQC